jgi:hypothetical protein
VGCACTPGNDLAEDACAGSRFFLKGRHIRSYSTRLSGESEL